MSLTAIPKLEKLSPLVFRVLGCNPGPFTLQGTNTYLVGAGKTKFLIDTGNCNHPEYINNLKETLSKHQWQISSIICTHWHEDHVGGISEVLKDAIGAHVPVHKYKRQAVADDTEFLPAASSYSYVEDSQQFSCEGTTLQTVYTPGHTDDHIALLLKEENTIFSGDCVLGEGTTVFEDLHSYMRSLNILLGLAPVKIYPGHGPVIDNPVQKIQEYIDHRKTREEQIVAALKTLQQASPEQIVEKVYVGIPDAVKGAAAANVSHHLSKLVKDGIVLKNDEDSYCMNSAKI